MRDRSFLRGLGLVGALLGALSACRSDPPPLPSPSPAPAALGPGVLRVTQGEVGRPGGHLVLALASDLTSFNPLLIADQTSAEIVHGKLFSSCLAFDQPSQEMVPALCEGFERSADGLQYTFTLREDLQWSDGAPLTSDDFAFSYGLLTQPDQLSTVRDLFRQGEDAQGQPIMARFEALDARRFRFHLTQPDVLFEANVASIYPVPAHKWRAVAEAGDFRRAMRLRSDPAEIVGSGPFVLQQYQRGERVVLARNPRYWKADREGQRLPYLDRLIYVIVRDHHAELLRFRDGELDAIEVRPEHYALLQREQARGDYTLHALGPSLSSYYLMFNLDPGKDDQGRPYVAPARRAWFENLAFRQAISHAIDREGIIHTVLAGRGSPMYSYFGPANQRWYNPKVRTWPHDPQKARALLEGAGFRYIDGKLHDHAGEPVRFSVMTNSENATRVGMMSVIKADLAQIGVEVQLRPAPFNEVVEAMRTTRRFEALLLGWGSALPPDPAQSKNVLLSSGSSHAWHPHQASPQRAWEREMDDALYANISTFDFEERKRHMDRVLEIWAEYLPQIMLVAPLQYAAGRNDLGNFQPSRLRPELSWNVDQIFLRQPRARR